MATKIVTKNSSTASAVPTASDLVQGELAVNVADKRLFTEDNGGAIVELGTNPSTIDINAGTIDGTAIGASSASTGAFTALTATGAFTSRGIDDNADATAITIDSSENVGIGTSSPAAKLHIESAGTNEAIRINTDTGYNAGINYYVNDTIKWTAQVLGDGTDAYRFYNFASGEAMRIDSSGNVGIGTSSPLAPLDVKSATGNVGFNYGTSSSPERANLWYDTDGSGWKFNIGKVQSGSFTSQVTIQDNGNVGIGTSSPRSDASTTNLHVSDSQVARVLIESTNPNGKEWGLYSSASGVLGFYDYDASTEAMRIDSSGNLLVGKTSSSFDTQGVAFRGSPDVGASGATFTRDDDNVAAFNRLNSDGSILTLNKDGTSVGSIGASGGDMFAGTGDTGLRFVDADNAIVPWNTSSNAGRDNAIDLGKPSERFDDIYATNGTIQTSDRNEKQDIAELSDAEQRVAVACKGLLRKFRWKDSVAEKGDDARIHFGIIAQDLQAAFEAEGLDASDYAMFISTTWTDEETNEEKTRMGVRYSELLAFIIAAI